MNLNHMIAALSVTAGVFLLAFVVCFTEVAHYRKRALAAERNARQHYANLQATINKAALRKRDAEQVKARNNLLMAHNNELKAENEKLHNRVLYLTNLIRYADEKDLARMAVMDGPMTLVPRETINLN